VTNDGFVKDQNVHSDVEIVFGGSGENILIGSAGYNVLVGGDNEDLIDGGGGRDVLIGGGGRDTLQGSGDDDLLIGGRTTFSANLPVLRTLSIEWREPTRSYTDRIARLKAGVSGAKIDASTIVDDLATDFYNGTADRDWFVKHNGDSLNDRTADETVTAF
jgi:Ca2+-binding RTX toxin-like protein